MLGQNENLTFPGVFHSFYENFQEHLKRNEQANGLLKLSSFISCFTTFVTILIVWKASSRLKIEYRNILLSQLVLAFFGCFLVSLASPSFLLPYPVIFFTGPFAINYRVTLYLSSTVVLLYFMPTMLLLSFGLIYNFMSLKQLTTVFFKISIEKLLKRIICAVVGILILGNCAIIFKLSAQNDQVKMQNDVFEKVDPRCAEIFQKHAVFVFDIYSVPMKIVSIEALALSGSSIIFCSILMALSFQHFGRQKPNLSPTTAKNHRMMMWMLISYVAHFLIYFAFPLAAFTKALHDVEPFLGNWTFLIIMSPAHFLGISLSVTYCVIISPYRRVCIAVLMLITCTSPSPHPRSANSTSSSSMSVIEHIMRRHNYRVAANA